MATTPPRRSAPPSELPDWVTPSSERSARLLAAFDAAVTAAGRAAPEPEMLPSRLSVATAAVLAVAGAGISIVFPASRRLPLGASDADAAVAERLQFTAGDGPCWTAQATARPVVAGPHEMQRQWPLFHDDLMARTPYRAVVSLPLTGRLLGVGTLDLYLATTAELRELHLADTIAVSDAISARLSAQLTADQTDPGPDPDGSVLNGSAWLASPGVRDRARVWQAMGLLDGELEVPDDVALSLLRGRAHACESTVDEVAAALVDGRLTVEDLRSDG